MNAFGGAGRSPARNPLPALLTRLDGARSREQVACAKPGAAPSVVHAARLETLGALLDYASAIEALSWPVPRSILLEIRLHEALLGPASRRLGSADAG